MSSTVVFRCIRVWVVHFRGGFIEVFGRPPPEVGPAGPISEIRSEFPGRVLSGTTDLILLVASAE